MFVVAVTDVLAAARRACRQALTIGTSAFTLLAKHGQLEFDRMAPYMTVYQTRQVAILREAAQRKWKTTMTQPQWEDALGGLPVLPGTTDVPARVLLSDGKWHVGFIAQHPANDGLAVLEPGLATNNGVSRINNAKPLTISISHISALQGA